MCNQPKGPFPAVLLVHSANQTFMAAMAAHMAARPVVTADSPVEALQELYECLFFVNTLIESSSDETNQCQVCGPQPRRPVSPCAA